MLITITLLAFIVVLLVGLAAYTRIETAVAGNTQRQAQARENAFMALEVALGQLQQYAGPDQRVTATAEAFDNTTGTSRYTGVWPTDPAATDTPATPLTWLVSGNELTDAEGVAQPRAVTPASPGAAANLIELVGRNSTGAATLNANYVRAPLQPIQVKGLPGAPASAEITVGRYAWWVGDQGVKAPVALPDTTTAVDYAPYDSAELRARIRQQVPLGAAATNGSGSAVFDARDSSNTALVANEKITAANQLAFLRWTSTSSATTKLSTLRSNFHTWSANNFNVLANTVTGGLRQDLSLAPTLLGDAFAAWANYPAYMEPFVATPPAEGADAGSDEPAPAAPSILPAYGTDPLRRRFPISSGAAGNPRVAPVLTYFHLLFGLKKEGPDAPFQLSVRWAAALWNPHTSALVPEDLRLEISGLPETVIPIDATAGVEHLPFNLRALYGEPLKVTLPWAAADSTKPQERSWLPGRVYNWTYQPEVPFDPTASNPGRYGSRDLEGFDKGLIVTLPGSPLITGSTQLAVRLPDPTSLVVQLKRADGEVIGTYALPTYDAVAITEPENANAGTSHVGFVYRLAESVDTAATPGVWLSTAGRDPRAPALPPEAFVAAPFGTDPAAYRNYTRIRAPDRLLDRDILNGLSYNEDVPVFELPRRPLLSLGELQHLYLPGARPFAFGNPWGAGLSVNGIPMEQAFDRFFFSGVAANVTPAADAGGRLVLPASTLRLLRKADGTPVSADDVRTAPNAQSSKFMLQGGAFNVNSTNAAAWAAVLRSVRFPAPAEFRYLDASPLTGTADDGTTLSHQSGDAHFFRFPQSAQEVYKADAGYLQSTPAAGEEVAINTHLFRNGVRMLTAAQLAALSTKIAELVRKKHAAADELGGPFRSLGEFLKPSSLYAVIPPAPADPDAPAPAPGPARSLLEAAIEEAGINGSVAEFSSQWLTPGDIMTALAPMLFPRSDTFVIRAYGEAINPAKLNNNGSVPATAVEGRAWCEAIVQRLPEFFDPSVPPETPLASFSAPSDPADPESGPTEASRLNDRYGRRFKIVSFRWLTRSDI